MEVSNRIYVISNFVNEKKIADIGTDHGYISIYTALNNNVEKIIASDVNKKPLESCKKNIKKYNLENIIETRLGNGLEKLKINEVDCIIIAGMGGNLIIDILKNNLEIVKNIKQLILQPQSNIFGLRKFIHNINFKIENEKIIYEDNIYYNILNCLNKKEEKYSELEYFLGKNLIEENSIVFNNYVEKNLSNNIEIKKNALENLKNIKDNEVQLKILDEKINMYKKFLKL